MKLKIKNLGARTNDSYIKHQYLTDYSTTSLSRYKHGNKLLLADDKIINGNLNPWDMMLFPQTGLKEFVVTSGEENRIDIVATMVYGSASLYWVLCYMNAIDDPLTLPIGTILQVPNLTDLFTYPNPLA